MQVLMWGACAILLILQFDKIIGRLYVTLRSISDILRNLDKTVPLYPV